MTSTSTITFNTIIKSRYLQTLIFNHVHQMNLQEYIWGLNLQKILYRYAPSSDWLETHRHPDSILTLGDIKLKHIKAYARSKKQEKKTLKTFLYLVDRYKEMAKDIDALFTTDTLHRDIVEGGSVWLLDYVLKRGNQRTCSSTMLVIAAKYGHDEMHKYIFDYNNHNCSVYDIDRSLTIASKNGNIQIIQYVLDYSSEMIIGDLVDNASENGHLSIVQYLTENKSNRCTKDAMDNAAMNGYLSVVQYLSENRTEGCTTRAIDKAAKNGHLPIVQYLSENRTEGCTTRAIDKAAKNGHQPIVQYLTEKIQHLSKYIPNLDAHTSKDELTF